MRGVDKDTGEWHALKFMSRDAYSPRKELEILSAMKHPNIIPCLGVYEPTRGRKRWVLATPEADFNLHEYLQRSRGLGRCSEEVVRVWPHNCWKGWAICTGRTSFTGM